MIYLGKNPVGISNYTSQFELLETYTVEESWDNDTYGNPIAIKTALDLDNKDFGTAHACLLKFKNNIATSYAADVIIYALN